MQEYEAEDRVRILSEQVVKEAGEKFMRPLYTKDERILMISDLKPDEVKGISYLMWLREAQNHYWIQDAIENYLAALVSKRRKGRIEYIKGMVGNVEDKVRKWMRMR